MLPVQGEIRSLHCSALKQPLMIWHDFGPVKTYLQKINNFGLGCPAVEDEKLEMEEELQTAHLHPTCSSPHLGIKNIS